MHWVERVSEECMLMRDRHRVWGDAINAAGRVTTVKASG